MRFRIFFGVCSLLAFSVIGPAQTNVSPAGHWEGSITLPSGELKIVVDLDRDAKGAWVGDIDIPQQAVKDMPLKGISISGSSVSFELAVGPGNPKLQGKLSEDGNSIAGELLQGGNSFPFTLQRAGEAKVSLPAKNPELPEKFTGRWEGTLETPSGKLRVVFNLANKEGSAAGTIDSPDQGATGIPMDEISAAEDTIKITVRVVGGGYTGKLSQDGKGLTGEWSQGGGTVSLVLTKVTSR